MPGSRIVFRQGVWLDVNRDPEVVKNELEALKWVVFEPGDDPAGAPRETRRVFVNAANVLYIEPTPGIQAPPPKGKPRETEPAPKAGWYQDPLEKAAWRYWDGTQWTDQTEP